tara:strand:+ start:533 stop:844 length:312 start_codon:yes stop_codon:yes gene_type:complete
MAERKKLTTRNKGEAAKEAAEVVKEKPHVDRAMKDVKGGAKTRRVIYDTHPDVHSKLSMMRSMSANNVPVKAFLDEAVEDLFEKYLRGEGRFEVKDIERLLRD